jgi:hypothetical protein
VCRWASGLREEWQDCGGQGRVAGLLYEGRVDWSWLGSRCSVGPALAADGGTNIHPGEVPYGAGLMSFPAAVPVYIVARDGEVLAFIAALL